MYKIITGRGKGKTSILIEMSFETGAPIVTRDSDFAEHIVRMAKMMNLPIPEPITYHAFVGGTFRGKNLVGLLVDDADALVQWIADNGGPVPVLGLSMCPPDRIWLTDVAPKP